MPWSVMGGTMTHATKKGNRVEPCPMGNTAIRIRILVYLVYGYSELLSCEKESSREQMGDKHTDSSSSKPNNQYFISAVAHYPPPMPLRRSNEQLPRIRIISGFQGAESLMMMNTKETQNPLRDKDLFFLPSSDPLATSGLHRSLCFCQCPYRIQRR